MSRSTISTIGIKSFLRSKTQSNLNIKPHRRYSSSSSGSSSKFGRYVVGGLLGSTVLVGGGSLLYAKYDPDFRKKLGKEVPYANDVLGAVLGPPDSSPKISEQKPSSQDEGLLKRRIERYKSSGSPMNPQKVSDTVPPPPPPPIEKPKAREEPRKTSSPDLSPPQETKVNKSETTGVGKKSDSQTSKSETSRSNDKLSGASPQESSRAATLNQSSILADQSKKLTDMEKEVERKIELIRDEYEKELTKQLKRQMSAHLDHLKDQLEIQRMEIERKNSLVQVDKVLAIKKQYYEELEFALIRLNEIERIFKARENLDKEEIKARKLWLLCQHLNDTLRGVGIKDPQPLKKEVDAISQTVADMPDINPLALNVLNSIPKAALDEGVYNQDTLIGRYAKVEKFAKRVALVGDEGGSLGKYLLSYIQSLLIFDLKSIPAKELTGELAVDPSKWDTFDILSRVRHCLSERKIEQALRYANQLKGASRKVAKDWIKDVRTHLEVRQAADLIQAQASSVTIRAVK